MNRIRDYINTDPLGAATCVLVMCGTLALVVFGQ